mmetsp:Transcript_33470/g.99740  ORF Transcript_33470/g.99740 Transcript_33470/m.99740 type:complete len:383 (+) Transcript_33470:556-1704(+)
MFRRLLNVDLRLDARCDLCRRRRLEFLGLVPLRNFRRRRRRRLLSRRRRCLQQLLRLGRGLLLGLLLLLLLPLLLLRGLLLVPLLLLLGDELVLMLQHVQLYLDDVGIGHLLLGTGHLQHYLVQDLLVQSGDGVGQPRQTLGAVVVRGDDPGTGRHLLLKEERAAHDEQGDRDVLVDAQVEPLLEGPLVRLLGQSRGAHAPFLARLPQFHLGQRVDALPKNPLIVLQQAPHLESQLEAEEVVGPVRRKAHVAAHVDELHAGHVVEGELVLKVGRELDDDLRGDHFALPCIFDELEKGRGRLLLTVVDGRVGVGVGIALVAAPGLLLLFGRLDLTHGALLLPLRQILKRSDPRPEKNTNIRDTRNALEVSATMEKKMRRTPLK